MIQLKLFSGVYRSGGTLIIPDTTLTIGNMWRVEEWGWVRGTIISCYQSEQLTVKPAPETLMKLVYFSCEGRWSPS